MREAPASQKEKERQLESFKKIVLEKNAIERTFVTGSMEYSHASK